MTPALPADLEIHGWLEAGTELHAAAPDPADAPGPSVGLWMARWQTQLRRDTYGAMLQLELANPSDPLLDAVVSLGRRETVQLRVGHFKTPFSLDFGIPAPAMLLAQRPDLVAAAPRRATGIAFDARRGPVALSVGAYDPAADLATVGPGVRPIASADVFLGQGWQLHAGATSWWGRNARQPDVPTDALPVWDDEADLGVGYAADGTTLLLEGLAAHALDAEAWEGGVGARAAHRFPLQGLALEPVLAWDSTSLDGSAVHAATAAVNVHVDDWFAVAHVSGETVWGPTPDAAPQLVARASVQVGF